MPFLYKTPDPSLPVLYNVEQAVGNKSPNACEDVKLTQHLLRELYACWGKQPAPGQLTVDGICGPVTVAWITRFQQEVSAGGGSIQVDSRVDRVLQYDRGSISQTVYSLVHLNRLLRQLNPGAFSLVPGVIKLKPEQEALGSPYATPEEEWPGQSEGLPPPSDWKPPGFKPPKSTEPSWPGKEQGLPPPPNWKPPGFKPPNSGGPSWPGKEQGLPPPPNWKPPGLKLPKVAGPYWPGKEQGLPPPNDWRPPKGW